MSTLEKAASDFLTTLTTLVNSGAQDLVNTGKTLAPEAWRIAVYQVRVDAFCSIAAWLLIATILGVFVRLLLKKAKNFRDSQDELLFHIIAGALGIAIVFIIAAILINEVPRLLNPEYKAAENILLILKPVCNKTQ